MSTVLISFIGRTPKNQDGYRQTVYRFPNGEEHETAYFGWSLAEKRAPDRMVILGTSGSMWEFLVETQNIPEADDTIINLMEACEKQTVTQAQLDSVKPLLNEHCPFELELGLIPAGSEPVDLTSTLEVMSEHVNPDDQVILDIAHGLRHLPMLALVCAMMLRRLHGIEIQHIYYGQYNPDTKLGTVHDLHSMLHLMDWVQALERFDHDGNYGVFAPLLEKEGIPEDRIRCLSEAAYYERLFNLGSAQAKLNTFMPVLNEPLPGTGALFTEGLKDRLSWAKDKDRGRQQWHQAEFYLKQGDYPRAAIFGCEAFISSLLESGEAVTDHNQRENAEQEFRDGLRGDPARRGDYEELKKIRNSLAHGNRPKKGSQTEKSLKTQQALDSTLKKLFSRLRQQPPKRQSEAS